MSKEVVRLPMPDHLEPKNTTRSLAISVQTYFYQLYNAANKAFRDLLASVGNNDAIHGNRLFDRHVAVGMIKGEAKKANDTMTVEAKDGEIYKHIVRLMNKEGMSLKLRRREYKLLTHQAPAE